MSETILNYEEWYELNESELNSVAYEEGMTDEYDWDSDRWFEEQYDEYLDGIKDTQDENDPFYADMPLEYTSTDTDTENIPF